MVRPRLDWWVSSAPGTYFQTNELFLVDHTARDPLRFELGRLLSSMPPALMSGDAACDGVSTAALRRRLVYVGHATSSITRDMSAADVARLFNDGAVCVRGFCFFSAVNLATGPREERMMTTGLHVVCDVYCSKCMWPVGWRYEVAYEKSQKYKEGKVILERACVVDVDTSKDGDEDSEDDGLETESDDY
ncbi:hypothetical protein GPECTOR_6g734 [Gonium pectorale]|uniref:Yippee domain-containing protein n=1 Tax=Gonium pectorale TaxID=33097 RepID=A0A150GVA8_GONPE|nr:hypothetical protein GPECTOR_6g734 [Gonium pectorale]|eukprot:KXZ53816.1 hypothetical protein GPECTOR_6g734 [Gonium pectorale]